MDVRFRTPANLYICGQSQSRKLKSCTFHAGEFGGTILSCSKKDTVLLWENQKEFDGLSKTQQNIEFVEGFPDDLYDLLGGHENSLVILDDLMPQCSNDTRVSDLFTRGSHNRGISVFFLTQIYFRLVNYPGLSV